MRLEIRAAETDADLERYVAVGGHVAPESALTAAELREIAGTRELVRLLALADGEPVGTAHCVNDPTLRAWNGAWADVKVLPALRRRGIGGALYRAISDWARPRGIERFEAHVRDDDADSIDWAGTRGFAETRREQRVELDLRRLEPPPVSPPPGIEIVSWAERPDTTRGMYEVALEAYGDIPGSEDEEMEPFEDWLAHDLQGPGDRPEATFVALAGDDVVGYAKFSLTDAQPDVAYHDLTGVKRAWRGRGIAGGLKRAEIAWAKAAGYERLVTENELRNEPIRRLNERLGYRPVPGRLFLRGPLAAD